MSYEIDLRGLNVEEGIMELNKYFDSAMLSGFSEVCVIHGVGTGVLKKGVFGVYKQSPYVKEFRPGGYTEGGAGVTIVTLK